MNKTDCILLFAYTAGISSANWKYCSDLLSEAERAQLSRTCLLRHQREHLLGRALARLGLGLVAHINPKHLEIDCEFSGKPITKGPSPAKPYHFNIAHAHGMCVCLIAL